MYVRILTLVMCTASLHVVMTLVKIISYRPLALLIRANKNN